MSETPKTDTWNPDQYQQFKNERSQPFFDLLDLVQPRDGMDVIDLGCGTGELTRVMHQRLGARSTIGLDSSSAMLDRAAANADDGLTFRSGDIATIDEPDAYDLVFSNAALQWVENHETLIPRLVRLLRPGGQIAFQMPMNELHPSQSIAADLAGETPYAEVLGGYRRREPPLPVERYVTLLDELGFTRPRGHISVYTHYLSEPAAVLEWVRGSMLTDHQRRLPESLFTAFVDEYRRRLLAALPDRRPYLLTYNRVLVWGQLA